MTQNKSDSCFNCGESLKNEENYCPNCGQKNMDLNISFNELLKDFASDYFTFDSKFLRTVFPLLFKPGKVPKDFIEGKRLKYIAPLRGFLFLSFISFFLWGLSVNIDPLIKSADETILLPDSLENSAFQNQVYLDSISQAEGFNLQIIPDSASSDSSNSNSLSYLFDKKNSPQEIADSLGNDNSPFIKKIIYQFVKIYQADRAVVRRYFMGNLSIVLLFVQPFFALLLKLFYFRKKDFFYIEHLVFSLYFHAFVLLISIFLFFLSLVFEIDLLLFWVFLLSLFYLIFGIKNFYSQGLRRSFFKGLFISFLYFSFILPVFIVTYLLLSLYFY
jgi:hypothetical protein